MASVLITGASTGFGYEAACRLARHGHRVFATMREVAGRNAPARDALQKLAVDEGLALEVVDLDVTDEASVNRAVAIALERAGHLDVVINNAGVSGIGVTEAYTPEQFHRMFDVNLYGIVRVNRAVLPAMRRRGQGLLIHISSAAGRVAVPSLGPYCATKFAVEALADVYRFELQPCGIQSVLVEPGIYRTPIFDHLWTPADHERLASCGAHASDAERVRSAFVSIMAHADNPGASEVADALVHLVELPASERPFRTVVSAPLVPLLTPYNEAAEAMRPIVAGIVGVPELATPMPSLPT